MLKQKERESNISFKNKCLLKTIAAAVDLGANYFFKKKSDGVLKFFESLAFSWGIKLFNVFKNSNQT